MVLAWPVFPFWSGSSGYLLRGPPVGEVLALIPVVVSPFTRDSSTAASACT